MGLSPVDYYTSVLVWAPRWIVWRGLSSVDPGFVSINELVWESLEELGSTLSKRR